MVDHFKFGDLSGVVTHLLSYSSFGISNSLVFALWFLAKGTSGKCISCSGGFNCNFLVLNNSTVFSHFVLGTAKQARPLRRGACLY